MNAIPTKEEINKLFIEKIEESLSNKTFKNKREIVEKLQWSETALSMVISGKRSVPTEKANLFFKLINYDNTSQNGKSKLGISNAVLLDKGDSMVMMVPLVGKYAYAGYQAGYGDDEYIEELPKIPLLVDKHHKGTYRAFEIKGDSMDNGLVGSYQEGYIVSGREIPRHHWRDKLHIKKWPSFIIVTKQHGVLVKQISKHDVEKGIITLHSWNEDYEDIEMHLDDVDQLLNVVDVRFK